MTPLLVLADTHALARHYADTYQLGAEADRNWRFIRHVDQVHGLRDGRFVVITGPRPIPSVARQQRGDTIAHLKRNGFQRIDP